MPNFTIDGPDLPAGWEGSANALLNFIRENWGGNVATGQSGTLNGQIGGTEPTTDIGLYIIGKNIKVWDADKGKYVIATDVPIGAMLDWAGGDAGAIPENYLLCDGRTLQNTDDQYVDLYEAIGKTWGPTGGGATDFNLPDSRGRVCVGAGQGDYAVNSPTVAGRMQTRSTGAYWGFEWIQKAVARVTGQPTQPNSVAGGFQTLSTQYTGCQQPSMACRRIIRYK